MTADKNVTIQDIATALGLSVGTVHRALHDLPGVSHIKKTRVLQMAKELGYRPNLAARYLRSKRNLVISVHTPLEIASFYDPVRAGIDDESSPAKIAGVETQHRTFPRLGTGEEAAFEAALEARVDGIIFVPGDVERVRPWVRRAGRMGIPVVSLINEAPGSDHLAAVSVDTTGSGALVAELMGNFLQGRGSVALTSGDLKVPNHLQKVQAFGDAMSALFPGITVHTPVENHESEEEAYERTLAFLAAHPEISGLYVSTGNATPVLQAIEDAGLRGKLTVFTTNLFPALARKIESRDVVGTIFERPYSQARIAFRILYEFLVNGICPSARVTLAPLLVMRSNLKQFLHHDYLGTETMQTEGARSYAPPLVL